MGLLKLRDIKMPERWTVASTRPANAATDSLEAFSSEEVGVGARESDGTPRDTSPSRRSPRKMAVGLAVLALVGAGLSGYFAQKWRPLPVEAATASLTIESDPPGAEVLIAGVRRGTTPLSLTVAPAEHAIEVVSGGRRKPLRALARAGAVAVYHVEFAPLPAVVVAESPRSSGRPTPPVTRVAPVSKPARGGAAGWLRVGSPVALEIREGKDVIGPSRASRIMLPAGRHDLQLVNEALGVFERRAVRVQTGDTVSITIELPRAPLSINAVPWAEVWVDGTRAGETPIGNYLVSVGTHSVVFKHPELGERHQSVTVSVKGPSRVSADMRKPQ